MRQSLTLFGAHLRAVYRIFFYAYVPVIKILLYREWSKSENTHRLVHTNTILNHVLFSIVTK